MSEYYDDKLREQGAAKEREEILAEIRRQYDNWPGNIAWQMIIDWVAARGGPKEIKHIDDDGGDWTLGDVANRVNELVDAVNALRGKP